jgi:hypothetical protein
MTPEGSLVVIVGEGATLKPGRASRRNPEFGKEQPMTIIERQQIGPHPRQAS